MGKGETLMPAGAKSFRSGTKNPMGKDRVRDRKIKKLSQMMESQNKKPSKRIYFEKDRLKKMVEKELNKKSPYLKQEGPKRRREPIRSKTDNPMGKDRLRDRKMKNIRDMRERRESLRQNKKPMSGPSKLRPQIKGKPKPSLGDLRKPKNPKGTGAPIGGFRKPKFNPRRVKTSS